MAGFLRFLPLQFRHADRHERLQREATLHLIRNHFADGEGGGSCRRGGVAHVEHPTAQISDAAVEDEVIHQVPVAVEGLSSDSRWTSGQDQWVSAEKKNKSWEYNKHIM